MAWTVDLTGDTADTVERDRTVDPDWYVATVDDTYEDSKSGAQVFEFKVDRGLKTAKQQHGQTITERLWNPQMSDEPNKAEMAARRGKIFACRLGLLAADSFGRSVDIEWLDAVGVQVVLKVSRREYKDKDDIKKEATNVEFGGIFPPDHPKIPADVRKGLGLPPARAEAGKGEATTLAGTANGAAATTSAASAAGSNGANGAAGRQPIDVSDL